MKDNGGFEHNWQAEREAEVLEERQSSRPFPGLNLTWEVREGILKHETRYDMPGYTHDFDPERLATLEAQIVAAADTIAYRNHDLDDGLRGGFITPNDLDSAGIEYWTRARTTFSGDDPTDGGVRRRIISFLINLQVTDLIEETNRRLQTAGINSVEDVRGHKEPLVGFSTEMAYQDSLFGDFLDKRLYHHYRVERMHYKAERCIRALFAAFLDAPNQLPADVHKHVEEDGDFRAICDYVAGMTDRFALSEHRELFAFYEGGM